MNFVLSFKIVETNVSPYKFIFFLPKVAIRPSKKPVNSIKYVLILIRTFNLLSLNKFPSQKKDHIYLLDYIGKLTYIF